MSETQIQIVSKCFKKKLSSVTLGKNAEFNEEPIIAEDITVTLYC